MAAAQDLYAEKQTAEVLSSPGGLGQYLVPVSVANMNDLLEEATQGTYNDESKARATAILARLKQLNSDIAPQFRRKKDALANIRLRMIRPNPQASVHYVSSYIAVSYCWHNGDWARAPAATPVSRGWEISEPMVNAVMALRKSPDEGVWLDKLCIDQGDATDKADHIAAMDAIYRSARRVAILLEDVQLDKDEEDAGFIFAKFYEGLCREVKDRGLEGEEKRRFIDEYFPRQEQEFCGNGMSHILAAAKPFAIKVLSARWYSRGWCAHESRMTKHQKTNNPLLMCFGSDGSVLAFEFRFIHYLGLYLSDSEQPQTLQGGEFQTQLHDPEPKTLRQFWWRIQRLMPDSSPHVSAMQHLVSILPFACLEKGDLMSIALNTAGIPLSYDHRGAECKAKPTSVEEVIWKFSLMVLASGDLVPLVSKGDKMKLPSSGTDVEFISWATNLHQGVLNERLPNPLPDSITAITPEYIEMDLFVFESLPRPATPDSQTKATRLIDDHDLDAVSEALLSLLQDHTRSTVETAKSATVAVKPNATPLPTLRHSLLSLALDNGLDWIMAFPSTMYQTTISWMHGPIAVYANPLFTAAAHSLFALFSDTRPALSPPSTNTLQTLTQFLTTLLDPRMILLTTSPRRLPLAPHLSIAALTSVTANRCYIAIPTVLAHLPGWHDRAWLVEPFDPAGKPEAVEDLLPPEGLVLARDGEEVPHELEDVLPVLNSDYADRRAAMGDVWKVRRRQEVFGFLSEGWVGLAERGLLVEGDGVMLKTRQRVYGCEDYPWGEISRAMNQIAGAAGKGAAKPEA